MITRNRRRGMAPGILKNDYCVIQNGMQDFQCVVIQCGALGALGK